ncbi:hypothetical protein GCM10018965_004640 [Nonomuraea roseola]
MGWSRTPAPLARPSLLPEFWPAWGLQDRFPDQVVVTFSTLTGEDVTTEVSGSISAYGIHAGDALDIVYDPVHPVYVIRAGTTDLAYFHVLIALSILAMIGTAAWSCIRSWAPSSRA